MSLSDLRRRLTRRGARVAGVAEEPAAYGDVPPLTGEQLRRMRRRRPGRPPLGAKARRPISIKLDPDLIGRLKRQARAEGVGYQTLIHRILEEEVG